MTTTNGYTQHTLLTRPDRLQNALDRLDEAIQRQAAEVKSKQSRFYEPTQVFNSLFKWIDQTKHKIPPYVQDSRTRDRWLRSFWRQEPHLAGVVNSVVSIDANRGFTLTSGRNTVNRYEAILREAENGAGWRHFMKVASQSYYESDMGAVVEIGRDGDPGPLRALYNVDPTACRLTGNPETPLAYYDFGATRGRAYPLSSGDGQQWRPGDYFRVASLPNTDQNYNGLGYCAVSRCIELVQLMLSVYEHDQERLGARAPKGLLLLNNISQDQWDMAMKARKAQLDANEQEYYGAVAVIAQMGSEPPDAKLFALSQLPDGFDIETTTNLLMFGIALAFGYDPIEFWPVMSGALGRGRETEIQHEKGTGKGGMDFIFSLQDRLQWELPDSLLFQFDERDAKGELLDAQVHKAWADVAAVLTEKGILDAEQAKMYLIDKGVIPADWAQTPEAEQEGSVDDEGVERSLQYLRREALQHEAVQRAIYEAQDRPEDIVRRVYSPTTNRAKEIVLWRAGSIKTERRFTSLPAIQDFHRPRVARATLFEGDGVEITEEDVEAAIAVAGARGGDNFAELLRAEPVEQKGDHNAIRRY
jgi:hypothetical protein